MDNICNSKLHFFHHVEPTWTAWYSSGMAGESFKRKPVYHRLAQLWIHHNGPYSRRETSNCKGCKMVSNTF